VRLDGLEGDVFMLNWILLQTLADKHGVWSPRR
jgi:hypothetical protein